MTRPDRPGEREQEPRPEEREPRERTVAPPIEREHETQEGALEEDARRRRAPPTPPTERT
jgi:hypothetical protein